MATLKNILDAFLNGNIGLHELMKTLDKILQTSPERAVQLRTLFRDHYHNGRISESDYLSLEERLKAQSAQAGNDEATRVVTGRPDTEAKTRIATNSPSSSAAAYRDSSSLPPARINVTSSPGPIGPGAVLKERFVLEQHIGGGGMGEVYKARDLRKEEARDSDPYIAVKVLTEEFKQTAESPIALQREAKKAQRLAHPNIATVYDFDRDGDTVYMTMQLLDGHSLQELLQQNYPKTLPREQALAIIKDICLGLAYAHEHDTIHADLKPANIFVTRQKTTKLLDFGIARAARRSGTGDQTEFSPQDFAAMTPTYASCEMFEGQDPDPRDDIYALACVAYEVLAGHHPFNRKTSVEAREEKLQPEPPASLNKRQWKGLRRGLAFNRNRRTPSVTEFLEELVPERKRTYKWVALGSLTIAAATVGVVLMQDPPDPCANAPQLDAAAAEVVEEILTTARMHLEGAADIPFLTSSADDAFRAALEKDACNQEARQGRLKVADLDYEHAQDSYGDGDLVNTWELIVAGLAANPEHEGLLELGTRMAEKDPAGTRQLIEDGVAADPKHKGLLELRDRLQNSGAGSQ